VTFPFPFLDVTFPFPFLATEKTEKFGITRQERKTVTHQTQKRGTTKSPLHPKQVTEKKRIWHMCNFTSCGHKIRGNLMDLSMTLIT